MLIWITWICSVNVSFIFLIYPNFQEYVLLFFGPRQDSEIHLNPQVTTNLIFRKFISTCVQQPLTTALNNKTPHSYERVREQTLKHLQI